MLCDVLEILKQFDMVGCKAASTPLEPRVKLSTVHTAGDGKKKKKKEKEWERRGWRPTPIDTL